MEFADWFERRFERTVTFMRNAEQSLRYDHKNFTGLHLAIKQGNLHEVMQIINKNEDNLYNTINKKVAGCAPLHVAITYNRIEITALLLKKGSDFTIKDDEEETPLHLALKMYSYKEVKMIFRAYYTACSRLNDNIRRHLKEKKIPIDEGITLHEAFIKSDFRPLHFAVTFQLLHIILILIDNGVHVNSIDAYGMTALHCAVQQSQTGLLQLDYLHTVLSKIVLGGKKTAFLDNLAWIVDLLLMRGSAINSVDQRGRTPMFYLFDRLANQQENKTKFDVGTNFNESVLLIRPSIISSLLSFRPDLQVKDYEGNTILHMLAKASGDLHMSYELVIVKRYVKSCGDVNELNNAGLTALYCACQSGYKKLVDILLENGADVNLTGCDYRERPIHAAVRYLSREPKLSIRDQIDMVQQLLRRGAFVDAELKDGTTPILLATCTMNRLFNIPLMMCLFNWGCEVNCADKEGRTPLHRICQLKYMQLIEEFIRQGADVNALDAKGNTPFSVVFTTRHFSLLNCQSAFVALKKLTVLGAPLCQANKDLYAFMKDKHFDMLEVGESILKPNQLNMERAIYQREYDRRSKQVPTELQCRAELEFMKTVHIDSETTLYDILRKNTRVLLSSRIETTDIFADTYLDEDYPVYGYLLKAKLRIAKKAALHNRARQNMKRMFLADVPDVFNKILLRINREDIVHFNEAFMPQKNTAKETSELVQHIRKGEETSEPVQHIRKRLRGR